MTAAEIEEKARKLAALINDPVPKITDEADLRDYEEHVVAMVSMRHADASLALLRARHIVDPPNVNEQRTAFNKRRRAEEQKKSWYKSGAEARHKEGAPTREHVNALAKTCQTAGTHRRQWVHLITKRTGLSGGHVRALLRKMGF